MGAKQKLTGDCSPLTVALSLEREGFIFSDVRGMKNEAIAVVSTKREFEV